VWGVPSDGPYWGRVQGNSTERVKNSPNQLPEVYLERLVRAYTNEGDRILDSFMGSGTLPTVASALGRNCDAVEMSENTCRVSIERIKRGAVRI
jgi:site-specific DNA-methyltransferase (adenine-specific)